MQYNHIFSPSNKLGVTLYFCCTAVPKSAFDKVIFNPATQPILSCLKQHILNMYELDVKNAVLFSVYFSTIKEMSSGLCMRYLAFKAVLQLIYGNKVSS